MDQPHGIREKYADLYQEDEKERGAAGDRVQFLTSFVRKYQMGVPYPGKYKEIFNSDAAEFGGTGVRNARAKSSKRAEHDERKNSIVIDVAPLSVQIFSYIKEEKRRQQRPVQRKP